MLTFVLIYPTISDLEDFEAPVIILDGGLTLFVTTPMCSSAKGTRTSLGKEVSMGIQWGTSTTSMRLVRIETGGGTGLFDGKFHKMLKMSLNLDGC